MATLVAQAVELYQYVAEEKSVSLHGTAAGPLPVTADADRIRQVLANLIDNAVKYTPPGGSVEVTAMVCSRLGSSEPSGAPNSKLDT